MKIKKLILFSIVSLIHIKSFGEGLESNIDYSKISSSNPFARYEYRTESEWAEWERIQKAKNTYSNIQNIDNTNYFNDKIVNPIKISSSNKYRYLFQNANQIGNCFNLAAKNYNLDPWLLMAISKTESSFNIYAINVNKNKSTDIGIMQINTFWLDTLKKYNIYQKDLFNACTNIFVGAWILKQNINHFGYNIDGIGAYNSPRNVKIRRNYATKVIKNYEQLIKDFKK